MINYLARAISKYRYYSERLLLKAVTAKLGAFRGGDISGSVVFKIPGNVYLSENVIIGPNCVIGSLGEVFIGKNTRLSEGVIIETASLELRKKDYGVHVSKSVKIGENVWIAMHSMILPGITIGDNSVIAAGSIVDRDIPANVIFKRGVIIKRDMI